MSRVNDVMQSIATIREYLQAREQELADYQQMLALMRRIDGSGFSPFGIAMIKEFHKHKIDVETTCRILEITDVEYNNALLS
jgi:hypothetical protein